MEACENTASSGISQIDSSSSEEKHFSCKMVTEKSSIDWQFDLQSEPGSEALQKSQVFSYKQSDFQWRLCHLEMATNIYSNNLYVDYIFLELISKPKRNVSAEVQVSFRLPYDIIKTASSTATFTVGRNGHMHIIARFMNRRNSSCIKCSKTECSCVVSYTCSCKAIVIAHYPVQEETLKNDMLLKNDFFKLSTMFSSNYDFDLKIVVNSATIPAHRMILEARSKVFLAMFQNEMRESKSNVINIVDFDEETVRQLVKFLYTSNVTKNDTELVLKLLLASDMYDIPDLRDFCESMLILQMDQSNVVNLLKHAVLIDSLSNLKNVAFAIIKTDPNHFSAEIKEKLAPVNSLFNEFEKLLDKVDITGDAIKSYFKI